MLDRNRVIDWWLGRLTDAQLAEYAGAPLRSVQLVLGHPRVKNELQGGGRGSRRTRRVPPKVRNAVAMVLAANDAGLSLDIASDLIGTFWYLPDTVNRAIDFSPWLSGVCSLIMHEPEGGYLVTDIIPQHIAWLNVVPCRGPDDQNPSEGNVAYLPAHDWRPDADGHMRVEMPDGEPTRELIPLTAGPVYQGEVDPFGLLLPTNTSVEAMPWDDYLEIINGRWIFHHTPDPDGWTTLQKIHVGNRGATKEIKYRSRLLGEITEKRKSGSIISFLKDAGNDKAVSSLWSADDATKARARRDQANFHSRLVINLSLPVRRMKRRAYGLGVDGETVAPNWNALPVLPWPEIPPEQPQKSALDAFWDHQDEDFMRMWDTDAEGNRVLVGLTKAEYDEYETIDARSWKSRMDDTAFPWESVEQMHNEKDRWLKLHDKHELARLRRLAEQGKWGVDKQ